MERPHRPHPRSPYPSPQKIRPARDTVGMHVSGLRGSLEPTMDRKRHLDRKFADYFASLELNVMLCFYSLVPRRCVDFGQGPDDLISTTSGGLLLLRLSHGTDLHIEDYNIRVRVHSLRSRCSYHTGMTSTNTDNHSVVCELGLHCYSNPNCLLTNACCNVLRSFLIDT